MNEVKLLLDSADGFNKELLDFLESQEHSIIKQVTESIQSCLLRSKDKRYSFERLVSFHALSLEYQYYFKEYLDYEEERIKETL